MQYENLCELKYYDKNNYDHRGEEYYDKTRSKGSVNLPQGSVKLVVLCYFSKKYQKK